MGNSAPASPAGGPDFDPEGNYIGPIEFVRPGDLLTYDRLVEYDAFMRAKHGMVVKHLGLNEIWTDSGQRPFQLAAKPEAPVGETPTNPFDAPPTLPPEPSRPA